MKTEDATSSIHLRDTYCDRVEHRSNAPTRGRRSQPHSHCVRAETWYRHFSWDAR